MTEPVKPEEPQDFYRCGGCGHFVAFKNYEQHMNSKHLQFYATEKIPPPANPTPMPIVGGYPVPPATPEPKGFDRIVMNILLMRRSYPRAFLFWTAIVAITAAFVTSSLFLDLVVLHH